jgi:EAL domain-containing protein (putative c-di-GMP-specific phosphodiesterase class I)
MVDSLHMLAVANGVDTAEQAEALEALHCPLAQGNHLARPMPAVGIDRAVSVSNPVFTTHTAVARLKPP